MFAVMPAMFEKPDTCTVPLCKDTCTMILMVLDRATLTGEMVRLCNNHRALVSQLLRPLENFHISNNN